MIYKWLVIWWVVSVTQGVTTQSQDGIAPTGLTTWPGGMYKHSTILYKHSTIEEKHKTTDVNFALFATKKEANDFTKEDCLGYDGNTKLKFQIVELNPTSEAQRSDASDEQKQLLKGE